VQSDAGLLASPSQQERDLLSRVSPDIVCQLIDSVFTELVSEFKVHMRAFNPGARPSYSWREIAPNAAKGN